MRGNRYKQTVGCEGKIAYGSWKRAQGDAKHLKKKLGHKVEPYTCAFCGGIHLGHPSRVSDLRPSWRGSETEPEFDDTLAWKSSRQTPREALDRYHGA